MFESVFSGNNVLGEGPVCEAWCVCICWIDLGEDMNEEGNYNYVWNHWLEQIQ